MSLQDWLINNTRRQIVALAVVVFLFLTAVVIRGWLTHYQNDLQGISQLTDLMSLAAQQKNRTLLESLLDIARNRFNLREAVICANDQPLVSTSYSNQKCQIEHRPWESVLVLDIGGIKGLRLVGAYSYIRNRSDYFVVLALSIASILYCILVFLKTHRRFRKEIIDPMVTGLLSDTALSIRELEGIRLQLKEAVKLKSEQAVVAAVSERNRRLAHDIRSPLSALKVISSVTKEIPEDQRRLLESVSKQIQNLADRVLSETRSEISNRPMPSERHWYANDNKPTLNQDLHRVALKKLLEECIEEKVLEFSSNEDVRLTSILDKSIDDCEVVIDPTEFKCVISNLINNAVEAIPEKGLVSISAELLGGDALVEIRDTGRGIHPDVLPMLMEEGVTFGKAQGNGLGLSTARQIIEYGGGTMKISSVQGRGTTVSFTLPSATP